jgi:hypothetical protein
MQKFGQSSGVCDGTEHGTLLKVNAGKDGDEVKVFATPQNQSDG